MYEKLPIFVEARQYERLRERGRLQKLITITYFARVRNRNIVYSLDMSCIAQLLYGGYEAFQTWV